jgi:hypothetical protein
MGFDRLVTAKTSSVMKHAQVGHQSIPDESAVPVPKAGSLHASIVVAGPLFELPVTSLLVTWLPSLHLHVYDLPPVGIRVQYPDRDLA